MKVCRPFAAGADGHRPQRDVRAARTSPPRRRVAARAHYGSRPAPIRLAMRPPKLARSAKRSLCAARQKVIVRRDANRLAEGLLTHGWHTAAAVTRRVAA